MIYKIGLVGLPNVGKSSIFNLLSSSIKSTPAPFPYSTIQPVRAIVRLRDTQLDSLHQTILSWFSSLESTKLVKKEVYFELVDLAGIVPLDSDQEKKSELGASFLSHIRGVNLILLVVRTFTNESVLSQLSNFLEEHSELPETTSFLGDLKSTSEAILEAKLVLVTLIKSDLELINKMIYKYSKDQVSFDKELNLLIPLKEELIERKYIPIYLLKRYQKSTDWEKQFLERMSLLSIKKIVFVSNYGSSDTSMKKLGELKNWAKAHSFFYSSLNVEAEELYSLSDNEKEKENLRSSIYLKDSSIDQLLKTIVFALKLRVFYTFKLNDEKNRKHSLSNFSWTLVPINGEVRAWFFKSTETLVQAAARIHNDLSNFFVTAKMIESEKFLKLSKNSIFSNAVSNVSKSYQLKGGEVVQIISSV